MNHPDSVYHPRLVDPSGERAGKPKDVGLTMLIDKGVGLASFEEFLQLAGQYVDYIKLGFGTVALYPSEILQKKLLLAKKAGVFLYPGGTMFEVAYHQGVLKEHLDYMELPEKICNKFCQFVLKEHLDYMEQMGFSHLEISDGTIELPASERRTVIRKIVARGFTVITECGKKASGSHLSVEDLQQTLYSDLECGASYVIVEGRESGKNVGIYDKEGKLDTEFLSAVEKKIPVDVRKHLIWEAPQKNQQIGLIHFWGRNVNMGNIQFEDAYNLECLRRGLRFDTFILGHTSSGLQATYLADDKQIGLNTPTI
ncbi:phosphosulfolactate synthase [Aneurinibacillus thermoaerophilus]|uniref:Phosphosulfolactate synthase n=1 Tax=Aneurinibacillus thermoaerophilus TaxID=143495 RepID=A0A1G7Y0A0_ANETH|nr:phosphosulfolactate synthase [Aneurinibacillus thermoaerophilus]SDG89859.1 phosphosulfolactate synthase [Aneurinibacillus thermoaerophilus]